MKKDYVVLIPCYQPDNNLIDIVKKLLNHKLDVVLVNDGSSNSESIDVISKLEKEDGVIVLHNAVNLGKGAALKTGMNFIYLKFPEIKGVITADADGQHLVEDIIKIGFELSNSEKKLILGSRSLDKNVPLRCRIGNKLTKYVLFIVAGLKTQDTQTGLRGFPRYLIPEFLKIANNGYEYEMEMLLKCKNLNVDISEIPITTVYLENNKSSHFNPILDSFRIYFVLFRFTF